MTDIIEKELKNNNSKSLGNKMQKNEIKKILKTKHKQN